MDFLTSFMGRSGFLPHGYCFTWSPGLLWSMVGADAVIALAYFSIPLALLSFVRRRGDPSLHRMTWLFSAFIFACGLTHVMGLWTIWTPDYGLQAISKLITAALSLVTAVVLWRAIPLALLIPSVSQLQHAIVRLEEEVKKRRNVEDHLVDVQQSLAATLSSVGAGFIATDRQGEVTRMNGVAEQLLGWTQSEAQGHSIWTVFERLDRPPGYLEDNPVDWVAARGLTVDTPLQLVAVSRQGKHSAVEVKLALTYSDDGSLRGLAVVFTDNTQLQLANAESSRLAAIVESSNDAIISKTLSGQITSWNRAAQVMFGYSAAEAIGQSTQLLIPPQFDAEEIRMLNVLAQGQQVPAFDTVRLAKEGHLVEVSVTLSPIHDGAGRLVGASKIIRDISLRRQAAEARREIERLESENQKIQDSNRLKSLFLANMSHELRTPLNAVIGFADLLSSGAVKPDSPKHQQFLGHVSASGRHLLQLINDLLDLSKVESGKFEFFPDPVNLSELVQELCDTLHASTQLKSIELSITIAPAVTQLLIDPARLKQVLYNYLSNAIKFTPIGGQVTVRGLAEGDQHFRLEIEDNGIGISVADQARLFTEFQQLDAGYTKHHQGTGLGLALTRRLVEAQGGQVGVSSQPGVGSVFHLILPLVQDTATALDRQAMTTGTLQSEPAEASDQGFLVIESDLHNQSRLVGALKQAGYPVDAAANGPQALRQAMSKTYAAITLDLLLADRPGLGVLADIRSQGPSSRSPVVGLTMPVSATVTGQTNPSARFAISNILSKPIRTDEVAAAIAQFKTTISQRSRVLVIDDDPLALELMRATLASLGVEVSCVLDGRDALRDLELHRPDAIILDLMMPGFDGFAVLDALRRMPTWRDTPVFVWTSMILSEAEYASLSRSARAILSKGGGEIASLLEDLRRRRPAVTEQNSHDGGLGI
jgi:PAS domain S-box-containing protein